MDGGLGTSLVIGGGSGVGRGVALALAETGSSVVVADRDAVAANDTAAAIGSTASAAEVDATDAGSLASLASELDGVRLRTVVSTVGVIDEMPIRDLDDRRWQWAWELNVLSAVHVVDAFRDLLAREVPSTMVLTGSGSGLQIGDRDPALALYTTTKHALMGYVSSVRPSLAADGVALCLFVPHAVEGHLAETSALARSSRFGEPADVRGNQPPGRLLADPLEVGRLLVQGIDDGAEMVCNRPQPFTEALHGFATRWQQETLAAKLADDRTGPKVAHAR